MTKKKNYSILISLLIVCVCIILAILGYRSGLFHSVESFSAYIRSYGTAGILLLIGFQALQVVIPVLPGGIALVAGILVYGHLMSFVYNYIGICAGSVILFLICRHSGRAFINKIIPQRFMERFMEKYGSYLTEGKYEKVFIALMYFPIAPDDYLVDLAGITDMKFRKFLLILLTSKPIGIAAYTYGLYFLIKGVSTVVF